MNRSLNINTAVVHRNILSVLDFIWPFSNLLLKLPVILLQPLILILNWPHVLILEFTDNFVKFFVIKKNKLVFSVLILNIVSIDLDVSAEYFVIFS